MESFLGNHMSLMVAIWDTTGNKLLCTFFSSVLVDVDFMCLRTFVSGVEPKFTERFCRKLSWIYTLFPVGPTQYFYL